VVPFVVMLVVMVITVAAIQKILYYIHSFQIENSPHLFTLQRSLFVQTGITHNGLSYFLQTWQSLNIWPLSQS
jgi:uncharacterized membrane protein affecting hemolysin expression